MGICKPSLFLFLCNLSSTQALALSKNCDEAKNYSLLITAVGDILLHKPLQDQALDQDLSPLRFRSLWQDLEYYFKSSDIVYGNLEGPSASGIKNQGYPRFNYDPRIIADLKASGISIVSTGNNHSLDHGPKGADRTIANLRKNKLPFVGTKSQNDKNPKWYRIIDRKEFRTAWISCTYAINGDSVRNRDPYGQVLYCERDLKKITRIIRKLSQRKDIHAIFVLPHWGQEYQSQPSPSQKKLARRFFEAGALAIFGTHPHVLQPWERMIIKGREHFVIYSLGNFISTQKGTSKNTSILLFLSLKRGLTGKAWIDQVEYLPVFRTKIAGLHKVVPLPRLIKLKKQLKLAKKLHRRVAALYGRENGFTIKTLQANSPLSLAQNKSACKTGNRFRKGHLKL